MFTCGFERSNFSFAIVLPCLSARYFCDDLLAVGLWNLFVCRELPRVVAAALGHRAQVRRIAEHLRQRHPGRDDLDAGARLHVLDVPAPRGEIADHVAHVVLGNDDLDSHDLFLYDRAGLLGGFLVRHGACDLEGHFGGVDVMERAVVELDVDAGRRGAGEDAVFHRFLDALFDGLDELLGDGPALDLVLEDEVMARFGRLDADLAVTVLAPAARLADETARALGLLRYRLAGGD